MSVYTVEVRYICETEAGLLQNTGYNDVDAVIDKSWDKIFKNFPIFDEAYREGLCKKILNHYYTREIGAETVALWKFWLNQKMNEIMPYYNKLYLTEQLKYDPLHEIDFTREINEKTNADKIGNENTNRSRNSTLSATDTGTNTFNADNTQTEKIDSTRTITGENETRTINTGTVTTDSTTAGQDLHSDTPQGSIQNIKENGYLTDAHLTNDKNDSTVSTDTSVTTNGRTTNQDVNDATKTAIDKKNESNNTMSTSSHTDFSKENSMNEYNENNIGYREYIEHITGKNSSVSYSSLISEYRETLLNIDMDIIFELKDLFMNIY